MLLTLIIVLGGVGAVLIMLNAARGPSTSKTLKRRIEMVKERHGDVIAANAQAQIRKLFANRSSSQIEGLASTIIPKPALLRKRLEMTGREVTLSKYLYDLDGSCWSRVLLADDERRAVPAGTVRRPLRRHRPSALRRRQDDQSPSREVQRRTSRMRSS